MQRIVVKVRGRSRQHYPIIGRIARESESQVRQVLPRTILIRALEDSNAGAIHSRQGFQIEIFYTSSLKWNVDYSTVSFIKSSASTSFSYSIFANATGEIGGFGIMKK